MNRTQAIRFGLVSGILLRTPFCSGQAWVKPLQPEVEYQPEQYLLPLAKDTLDLFSKSDEEEWWVGWVCFDRTPAFPGGFQQFSQYLSDSLRYPSQASENKIAGVVYVSFIVQADGSLADVQVLKGIGYGCDEEVLRVIKQMPKWNPATQSGRPVSIRYSLPIRFPRQEPVKRKRRHQYN